MIRVAVIGAGALGCQLAHYVSVDPRYQMVGFFDDFAEKNSKVPTCSGEFGVLGNIDEIESSKSLFDSVMMGVGYKHLGFRKALYEKLKSCGFEWGSFVHSSASVDPSAGIEEGAIIFPSCTIDAGVVVGGNTLINVGCLVAHDAIVGAHSFLGPGVNVAGFTKIGEQCFLGIGTTIIDKIEIVQGCQTGGGTVVIKDLLEPGLWVGCPASFVRGEVQPI